jgi:hypothetical protein
MISLQLSTVCAMVAWFAWHDWDFPSQGLTRSEREHRGFRYGYRERFYKGRIIRIVVDAPVAVTWRFTLRREDGVDRLAKAVGLAVEMQTGDRDFDRAFFVDAHDPAVRRLLADGRLRDRLLDLSGRLAALGGRLRRILCADGELRIEVLPGRGETIRLEREAVNQLALLAELVAAARPGAGETGALERLHAVRVAYLGPWLLGTFGGLLVAELSTVRIVDRHALFDRGALVGAAVFLAFAVWAVQHVGRSPRRHRLIVELVLVALPGFALTAMLALRTIDVHFDSAPPETVTVERPSVYSSRSRRDRRRYWLRFRSDHPELLDLREVDVDRTTFERLLAAWPEGSGLAAEVPLHRGALGLSWFDAAAVQPR